MTLAAARTLFAMKNSMTRGAKLNFANDPEFKKQLWLCDCGKISSNIHFRYCIKYENLRIGKDLSTQEGIIRYLQAVIKFRDEEEKQVNDSDDHIIYFLGS